MKKVRNIVGFQVAWFVAVIGAAKGMSWIGPVAVLAWLAIHICLSDRPRLEIQIACATLCLGLFLDSSLIALEVYTPKGIISGWPVTPAWMLALWVNFGTLLNVSLSWLKGRYLLGACLGFLGGPAAYYSGYELGALTFQSPLMENMFFLAVAWAGAVPLLFYFIETVDKNGGTGLRRKKGLF